MLLSQLHLIEQSFEAEGLTVNARGIAEDIARQVAELGKGPGGYNLEDTLYFKEGQKVNVTYLLDIKYVEDKEDEAITDVVIELLDILF